MPSIFTLGGVVASLGLAGCVTYSPGSFHKNGAQFEGQLLTIECLDLGVAGQHDMIAPGPVVAYQFGNRCDHPIRVDLGAVRATGRTPAGEEVTLVPYDPYGEIKPRQLEAHSYGRERLEYRKARDFGIDLVQVCVELGGVTGDGARGERICVDAYPRDAQVAEVSP